MKTLRHALVFISALLGTSSLHAAPGDLDLSFGGGGKVTTAIGTGGDFGYSVIQQADGKLVVAGSSWNGSNADVALVRYNADGPLDTGFDGDGIVTTAIGAANDYAQSVIQQADGKLVVAGYSWNGSNDDVALVRYNTDGSLDTGFDGDGKVTTAIGAGDDYGYSVIQQSDGKLVVAGTSYNGSSYDFALVRYNADGSLDASFDGDGIVTTAIGAANDYAQSVIQQADGKLVVAGTSYNGSDDDFALVRYNADGSLDTSFDGDGKVTTEISGSYNGALSVIQQANGKLVVAGYSYNGNNYDVALVRYDSGQLITTTNLWLKKLATKVGAGSNDDRWSAQYLYNADRRSGQVFDPATDALDITLASSNIHLPAGSLLSKGKGFAYSSAKGEVPAIQVSLMPSTQTLTVSMSGTEIGAVLPETLANTVNLGSEQRALQVALDAKGKFLPTTAYKSEAVVVTSATVKDSGTTKDSLVLKLNLADPALLSAYDFDTPCPPTNKHCKQPEVAITLYDESGDVLLSKTLTSLLATTRTVSGITNIYSMKKIAADAAPDNILSAFSFASKKGALSLTLKNLVLNDALDSAQSQLGVAITIDGKIYFARVTLFETKSGSQTWSTKYSTYATPTP